MKERKMSNVFDSKIVMVVIICINALVLAFLVGYVVIHLILPQFADPDAIQTADSAVVEEADAEVEQVMESDESLSTIYNDLLAGMQFAVEDGTEFNFGAYGAYSGFFDDSHPNVSDYIYNVQAVGADIRLNIYDKDKENVVSYNMEFLTNGDIQLTYPDNGRMFVLTTN